MDDLFDVSQVTGNASDDIKHTVANLNPGRYFRSHPVKDSSFGESILRRMKLVDISLNKKAEEEKKMEAKVAVELDVTEG